MDLTLRLFRLGFFWLAFYLAIQGLWGPYFMALVPYVVVKSRQDRRVRERKLQNVPERTSPDPIPGVKVAYPMIWADRVVFHALVFPRAYGVEADASCAMGSFYQTAGLEHGPVPRPGCTCGFYAWKPSHARRARPERAIPGRRLTAGEARKRSDHSVRSMCVLDVELLGKVMVFERGYRAQRQRVMSVSMGTQCVLCGRRAKGFTAGTFIVGNKRATTIHPTCGCQMPVRWSLSDLANMAGTEVKWRTPPLTKRWRRA